MTSFFSALSPLPPTVCQRSQGRRPRLPVSRTAVSDGDAPSLRWDVDKPAQSLGNENLPGHNASSPPINSLQNHCSPALPSSATAPCSPSSSTSQANRLSGCGDKLYGYPWLCLGALQEK